MASNDCSDQRRIKQTKRGKENNRRGTTNENEPNFKCYLHTRSNSAKNPVSRIQTWIFVLVSVVHSSCRNTRTVTATLPLSKQTKFSMNCSGNPFRMTKHSANVIHSIPYLQSVRTEEISIFWTKKILFSQMPWAKFTA